VALPCDRGTDLLAAGQGKIRGDGVSYRDPNNGYKGVTYGAGAMVALGMVFALRMCATIASVGPHPVTPAALETELLSDPKTGALFSTIKRTYPEELETIKQDIVGQSKSGASQSDLRQALLTDLIQAGHRHHRDLLQAPHAPFAAYRQAEIAMVDALRTANPEVCAQYVSQGSFRVSHGETLPESLVIEFRRLTWEADAAGRDQPVNRVIARPGASEWRDISRGMVANGLNESEVKIFFDPAAIRHAPPAEQCMLGLSFLRAVHDLPGDRGDRLYAFMASRNT
jgi:hypothetical protein